MSTFTCPHCAHVFAQDECNIRPELNHPPECGPYVECPKCGQGFQKPATRPPAFEDKTGLPGYEPFGFCHFHQVRMNQIGPSQLRSGGQTAFGFLIATRLQHFSYKDRRRGEVTVAPSVSWQSFPFYHPAHLRIPDEFSYTAEEIGQLCGGN